METLHWFANYKTWVHDMLRFKTEWCKKVQRNFELNGNNMFGYHWHTSLLPILLNKPFKRMKTFFQKILHIFSNNSKKYSTQVKKTLLRNDIIWYALYNKFAILTDLGWKKLCFYSERTNFGMSFKNLNIQIQNPGIPRGQLASTREKRTALIGWFCFRITITGGN